MTTSSYRLERTFATLTAVTAIILAQALPAASVPLEISTLGSSDESVVSPTKAPGDGDVLWFGYDANGDGYADTNEVWTFDHGDPDPLEDWTIENMTFAVYGPAWHRINDAAWMAGGNPGSAPVISGNYSYWAGIHENDAVALGWDGGVGYGNLWNEQLVSPELEYDGSGTVTLSFDYWVNLEDGFDSLHVMLSVPSLSYYQSLSNPGFTGEWGTPTTPEHYSCTITELEGLAGGLPLAFHIVFELESDVYYSDEDGNYDTPYGPFCIDNVELVNNLVGGDVLHTFEWSDAGYTAENAGFVADNVGTSDIGNYTLETGCTSPANLSGNVLELHDASYEHPDGQHVMLLSSPIDLTSILGYPDFDYCDILAEFDVYVELPLEDGVGFRPGWKYRYLDESGPGDPEYVWSDRVGPTGYYVSLDTACARIQVSGAQYMPLLFEDGDANTDTVQFILELLSSCDNFGVPPSSCTGESNFTPIIDNIQVGVAISDTTVLRVPSQCYPSMQSAVYAADPGDTILVADGVYTAGNISFSGKDIVLMSENGRDHTTIDCLGLFRAFVFNSGETPAAVVDGFTIENGYDLERGGAVVCSSASSPTIRNCAFVACTTGVEGPGEAGGRGGAVFIADSSPILQNCLFQECSALEQESPSQYGAGGAIYARYSGVSIHCCVFDSCSTTQGDGATIMVLGGGGIIEASTFSGDNGSAVTADNPGVMLDIRECTIFNSTSSRGHKRISVINGSYVGLYDCIITGTGTGNGGAVYVSSGTCYISGCTIAGNDRGLYVENNPLVVVDNSVIWNNENSLYFDNADAATITVTCSNIDTSRTAVVGVPPAFTYGATNIWVDPLFCDPVPWTEAPTSAGDYSLQSVSPCLPANNDCGVLMGALGQGCVPDYVAETDTGQAVVATMGDVQVTYDSVSDSGVTTLILDDDGPDTPTGFAVVPVDPSTYYEVYTTAVFEGTLTVCVTYDDADVIGHESALALSHYDMDLDPPDWVDITTSLDTVANVLCGRSTSLSPFVLLEPEPATDADAVSDLPMSFEAHPSFPNPFNPVATISYVLPEATEVSIRMYDINGRLVRVLVDREFQQAGEREAVWDGRDDRGNRVASGVYFYRLQAGELSETKRMVLLK